MINPMVAFHERALSKINMDRLERYEAGESLQEIAKQEGVTVETVENYIKEIADRIEWAKTRELRVLKQESAIANEKIRIEYRKDLNDEAKSAVSSLLKSSKAKDKVEGLKSYLKVVSLEEKPTSPQTTVNVQQNNSNNGEPSSGPPEKMEERIARMRKEQKAGHKRAGLVIDFFNF